MLVYPLHNNDGVRIIYGGLRPHDDSLDYFTSALANSIALAGIL